jgi:hypothetical protein
MEALEKNWSGEVTKASTQIHHGKKVRHETGQKAPRRPPVEPTRKNGRLTAVGSGVQEEHEGQAKDAC